MSVVRPLFVIGTRPEAIKMAPLVLACAERARLETKPTVQPIVCTTGQHREMLAQVTDYFGIRPDVELDVMTAGQTLSDLTARCLQGLSKTIVDLQPDCIVAQGDTTTVMAAGLAAFYARLPMVHVEAGLRTGNLQAPWPEELNRRIVSLCATLHCAPTQRAAQSLRDEGVPSSQIHVTGNTVIDALLWTRARERRNDSNWSSKHAYLADRPLVLITGHRRENFGEGLNQLCMALAHLAARYPQVAFVYPVHMNPQVAGPVQAALQGMANVHLIPPAAYPEFVWLMDRARVIVTDSGGVQEEAPTLGKPVIVMRKTTERPEAMETGLVELVGTDSTRIVARTAARLDHPYVADNGVRPFGDGTAGRQIVDLIAARAWNT